MLSFCVRPLLAVIAVVCGLPAAAAETVSCQCRAAVVCDEKTCFHYDSAASDCFTFKMTFDRSDMKIRLCRDALCEDGKLPVEKTSDGQLIPRTSIAWGGTSGGEGVWIMVDGKTDFVNRQKNGKGLEVISGPCE